MILHRTALLCLALTPLIAGGQTTIPVVQLRSQAIVEGSVEVKVTTRAVSDAPRMSSARTQAQRVAIQLAQQRVLIDLLPRGLVVGNEIQVLPDGSFTMRVLAEGIDYLAASTEVAQLTAADRADRGSVSR